MGELHPTWRVNYLCSMCLVTEYFLLSEPGPASAILYAWACVDVTLESLELRLVEGGNDTVALAFDAENAGRRIPTELKRLPLPGDCCVGNGYLELVKILPRLDSVRGA